MTIKLNTEDKFGRCLRLEVIVIIAIVLLLFQMRPTTASGCRTGGPTVITFAEQPEFIDFMVQI